MRNIIITATSFVLSAGLIMGSVAASHAAPPQNVNPAPAPSMVAAFSADKPFVYPEVKAKAKKCPGSVSVMAKQVIYGSWGNGATRVKRLKAAGCNPSSIQAEVNRILLGKKTVSKPKSKPSSVKSTPKPKPKPSSVKPKPTPKPSSVKPKPKAPASTTAQVGKTVIKGGTAAQRALVASILGKYGKRANVGSVKLVSSGHLGTSTVCTDPTNIELNIKKLGNSTKLRQVLVHELMHGVQNNVYGARYCLWANAKAYKPFGGFEQMTDCMTRAATGSNQYLYSKRNCSAKQIKLAKQVVNGKMI